MKVVTKVSELRSALDELAGRSLGFVPTMGALHEGHLSLVARARKECAACVVSVFVNPTQFNDKTDLKNYPRTPEADAALLEKAGADVVFMPTVEEIYPEPDTRVFDFGMIDKVMEGATRPGHFNGVAQVVSRLFGLVKPDKAYFGEKDFQQIAIIKAMVAQLGLKVEIVECPIVRGNDGLALSSRNALLDTEHSAAAPHIYEVLKAAARQNCGDDSRRTVGMGRSRSREEPAAEGYLFPGRGRTDHAEGVVVGRKQPHSGLHSRTGRSHTLD